MTETWALAALWIGLALVAALLSIYLRIANALGEIIVGIVAGAVIGSIALGSDASWIKFLAGAAAIVLTFLAGAELDPVVFRAKWKEATAVGLVSFAAPFLACTAAAYYLLHWSVEAS
jgi:glutathione-regulated potassium-efflux system ancillary protein KefC